MSEDSNSERESVAAMAKRRGVIGSFHYALNGLLRTLCTQRNMKIHWMSGLAVMLVGMALHLNIAARASVIFCVFVVLCMEVLNTALEAFVDLHIKQYAQKAMVAKDAAAAAVLVLAFGAVIVFADVLFHGWRMVLKSGPAIERTLLFGLPLLGLTGAMLWLHVSRILLCTFGALALGFLAFLAWFSRDEVFSFCSMLFITTGMLARWLEPQLVREGPP